MNLYELFGVTENVTDEELAAAYERLRAQYREERWLDGEAGNEAARKLTELWPDEKFFIIKCAFGGSDMHIGWRSPSSGVPYDRDAAVVLDRAVHDAAYRFDGWCYHQQIAILDEGFAQLQAMGYEPEVIAFCWMQGESDTALAERAEPMYPVILLIK